MKYQKGSPMPDSLRVAAEERRNAHHAIIIYDASIDDHVEGCVCGGDFPCAERVFAELVITTLDEAKRCGLEGVTVGIYPDARYRLVPDPLGEHAN